MPITKSAKKALRASGRKKVYNDRRKKTMRSSIKEVKKTAAGSKADQAKTLAEAYQAIDKAAKRGVIKKNTAARKKSRLVKLVKKF
ncbi:30S ribosomal protein S20 [bacterium CG10_49_38]|nr:MAG: 30S ribosomal protein S20 [bacterium CG10_49_38]